MQRTNTAETNPPREPDDDAPQEGALQKGNESRNPDHDELPEPHHLELWRRICAALLQDIRREQYETWFRLTAVHSLDPHRLCIAVQNGFSRDWLQDYYHETVSSTVEKVLGRQLKVVFVVDPERAAAGEKETPQPAPIAEEQPEAGPGSEKSSAAPTLLPSSDVTLNPQYRFDSFVVGPCNRFAHAACQGVAEKPSEAYNPLFVHGNVGLGKTHLLQSLCYHLLQRASSTRILYLSCETFVNHFIGALENGSIEPFRNKYRDVDVLVVDDIHLLANKERTQEEFFHTFNSLYTRGKQIVLSSDCPPLEIPTLHDRLVSRFKWGLVTELDPPCYETRVAILKRKSRERGHEIPDDVARFLADRIDTNIRELEGAVTKLLGYCVLNQKKISLEVVRQCLRELFAVRKGQASIEDIMKAVSDRFGVKQAELQSRRRTQAIAYPRQIGMYLARRITRMSLEEIGGHFGGRDHSTVLYAFQKISGLAKKDERTLALVTELSLELQTQEPEVPREPHAEGGSQAS